jgi:hypothetical protein
MAAMELTSSGSESKQYRFELAAVEEVVASLPVRGAWPEEGFNVGWQLQSVLSGFDGSSANRCRGY